MGGLGETVSFQAFVDAVAREAVMQPAGFTMAERLLIGGLGVSALVLFAVMVLRRSGTAAAAFALTALLALSFGIVFGSLDFLTPGTRIFIGTLTASALVLFANAVLHTGRENILIAGLSAMGIGLLLTFGGLTAFGTDYAHEARLGMAGAAIASALLLGRSAFARRGIEGLVGGLVLIAILASMTMLDPIAGQLSGFWPVTLPALIAGGCLLLAALLSPLLSGSVPGLAGSGGKRAPAFGASYTSEPAFPQQHGWMASEAEGEAPPQPGWTGAAPSDDNSAPASAAMWGVSQQPSAAGEPAPPPPIAAAPDASLPLRGHDPVSSNWTQAGHAPPVPLEPAEYLWDPLAEEQVRCGAQVLELFGARYPAELDLEGLRQRLDGASLAAFDDAVLGGGDPLSGPFDLTLQAADRSFRFAGRRQVDHDGILMRIDGRFAAPQALETTSGPVVRLVPVMDLAARQSVGFDATPDHKPRSDDEARALIDEAGRQLKERLDQPAGAGAFAMLDAASLGVRFGTIASAVATAVRQHSLPEGAFLVGLDVAAAKAPRQLVHAARTVRQAGASVALVLRDPKQKMAKMPADMVWIDARDAQLERRGRKNLISQFEKRFGVPVLIRRVDVEEDAFTAGERGARFATGSVYRGHDDRIEPTPPMFAGEEPANAAFRGAQDMPFSAAQDGGPPPLAADPRPQKKRVHKMIPGTGLR